MKTLALALCLIAAPALADQHDPEPEPEPPKTVKVICGYEMTYEKVPVTVYRTVCKKVPIYREVPVCEPCTTHCEPEPCHSYHGHRRCGLFGWLRCR